MRTREHPPRVFSNRTSRTCALGGRARLSGYGYAVAAPDTMDTRCVGGFVASGATAHLTLTMHASTYTGASYATATVDPFNEIAESNEGNNQAPVSFTIN